MHLTKLGKINWNIERFLKVEIFTNLAKEPAGKCEWNISPDEAVMK